jgi:AcrR family transcriptional regulator
MKRLSSETNAGANPSLLSDDALSNADTSGRRDRKKRATREAICDAALQLVAERGYARVTIEDITEAVDVAARTFFNYFSSKEAAVIGVDPERIEQMRQSLLARPVGESPLQALRAVFLEYAALIDTELDNLGASKGAWYQRFCVVRGDPELLGAYSAYMAEVERGLAEALAERLGTDFAHDLYPALVTATTLAATRVAIMYWSANGGVDSLAWLTGAVIDNLAKGLVDKTGFALAPDAPHRAISHRTPSKYVDTKKRTRKS